MRYFGYVLIRVKWSCTLYFILFSEWIWSSNDYECQSWQRRRLYSRGGKLISSFLEKKMNKNSVEQFSINIASSRGCRSYFGKQGYNRGGGQGSYRKGHGNHSHNARSYNQNARNYN